MHPSILRSHCEELKHDTPFQHRLEARELAARLTNEDLLGLSQAEKYQRLKAAIGSNTPKLGWNLPNDNSLIQSDEAANPTENHYDRVYVHLLEALEAAGHIRPGDTLLENTSGNAGIAFSWVAQKLGYRPIIFVPGYVSGPRRQELENLAAEVHYSDDRERYLAACAEMMVAYLRENRERVRAEGHNIWLPNHSQNPLTPGTFEPMVAEVAQNFAGRFPPRGNQASYFPGEKIDFFIGGVGNGSTLLGAGRALKRLYPEAKVIGFEPLNACPYYQKYQQRWGGYAPKLVDDSEIPATPSWHDLAGTGGYGNIHFPFMEEAINTGVLDDIVVVPERRILPNLPYNDALPPQQRQGNTSLIAHYLADVMAQHVSGKNFFSMVYDRADRY